MSQHEFAADRPVRRYWGIAALAAVAMLVWVFTLSGSNARPAAPLPVKVLRVGVEPGALPLRNGERDYTSEGFEAGYARELASHFGVETTLLGVPRADQTRALREGRVDLVLTRQDMGAQALEGLRALPTDYRSGLSVAMRSDTPVRRWEDLDGRAVCASAGNPRAQDLAARVGGRLKIFDAPAQALVQVRTGQCDAAILDRTPLDTLLARKEWAKFSATLPASEPTELVALVAVHRAGLLAPLKAAVAGLGSKTQWARRHQTWASNVAFEVYFDQTGPDCH